MLLLFALGELQPNDAGLWAKAHRRKRKMNLLHPWAKTPGQLERDNQPAHDSCKSGPTSDAEAKLFG
jgi:hypothetical protein